MKAVMTRIARDVVMDKDAVAARKAFDRFTDCHNFAGRLVTEPARGHAVFAIDLLQIRATQPTRVHFDKNITGASYLWYFDIIDRNLAASLYKYCLHLSFNVFVPDIKNRCY
jgi:hypothetical protein